MRKEIFVCDVCGHRKRLDVTKRHWCEVCALKKENEMHPVRTKRVSPVGQSYSC